MNFDAEKLSHNISFCETMHMIRADTRQWNLLDIWGSVVWFMNMPNNVAFFYSRFQHFLFIRRESMACIIIGF
jgi:hypothetical protein